MLRDKAVLTLPRGDIGSPDDPVTGRFVFAGDLQITTEFRTGFLVGGRGAAVNNVIQQFGSSDEAQNGQGFFVDLGSGGHVITLSFRGLQDGQVPVAFDADGKPTDFAPAQWGNTGDPSTKTYADMTGENPLSQINCFEQYLRHLKIDSASPATLEYGEFSSSGFYPDSDGGDGLEVVLESPQFTRAADQPQPAFDGSITCIEAAAIENVFSALQRGPE